MLKDGALMRIYIAESTKVNEKPASRFLPEYFMKHGLTGWYGVPGHERLWP